jgi:hypothetical protein
MTSVMLVVYKALLGLHLISNSLSTFTFTFTSSPAILHTMRFTIAAFLALISTVNVVSGWRILNYSDGDCKNDEAALSGTGESECKDIDPSVYSIRFDPQVRKHTL